MRDEARIKRILKLIEDKWMKTPDQRFGQLCINLGIVSDDIRTWSLEDDELEEHLKKLK